MDSSRNGQIPPPSQVVATALDLLAAAGQEFSLPVQGNSMLPLIRAGDVLLVRKSGAPLEQGEILVFRQGDQLIAHRVLQATRDAAGSVSYLTQGDHALEPDPPVQKEQVVGRAEAILRGSRQMRLDTPAWRRINWLISRAMLGWNRLAPAGSRAQKKNGGAKNTRWRGITHRAGKKGFWLLLVCIQALFGRWKT